MEFTSEQLSEIGKINKKVDLTKENLRDLKRAMEILTKSEEETGYNNESLFGTSFADLQEMFSHTNNPIRNILNLGNCNCEGCRSKNENSISHTTMIVDHSTVMKIISILHTYKETELLELTQQLSSLGVVIKE